MQGALHHRYGRFRDAKEVFGCGYGWQIGFVVLYDQCSSRSSEELVSSVAARALLRNKLERRLGSFRKVGDTNTQVVREILGHLFVLHRLLQQFDLLWEAGSIVQHLWQNQSCLPLEVAAVQLRRLDTAQTQRKRLVSRLRCFCRGVQDEQRKQVPAEQVY